jgi:hypothetical protein
MFRPGPTLRAGSAFDAELYDQESEPKSAVFLPLGVLAIGGNSVVVDRCMHWVVNCRWSFCFAIIFCSSISSGDAWTIDTQRGEWFITKRGRR